MLIFKKWQEYFRELDNITQDNNSQKEQAVQHKNRDIDRFAVELLNDFLNYSKAGQEQIGRWRRTGRKTYNNYQKVRRMKKKRRATDTERL